LSYGNGILPQNTLGKHERHVGRVYENTWCSGGCFWDSVWQSLVQWWLFLGQFMTIPGAVVAVFGTVYDNIWCSGGCFWDSV
jgi:hypothetical protein